MITFPLGDLRPGIDADIVVEVGPGLEARQPGLVHDGAGVVDDQPVEEAAAVGRYREAEPGHHWQDRQVQVTR
jgi:hypothetical protein